MKDIIIDNFHIGYWDGFDYPDEALLCFDELLSSPCRGLINKYNLDTKMKYLHFILPYVAKLFNIDRNRLRKDWVVHFGYYECFGKEVNDR